MSRRRTALVVAIGGTLTIAAVVIPYTFWPSTEKELVVISSEGSDRRVLANGCCIVWSPDGTKLAVGKVGSGRIYVVRADQFGLTGRLRGVLRD